MAEEGDSVESFKHLTKRKVDDALSALDEAAKHPLGAPLPSPKKVKITPRKREVVSTPALVSILAASRPLPRPPPTVPESYTPTSLPDVISRISTFRLATYSPKPPSLSPPSCALHGWHNKGQRERLECVTCHKGLLITPPTSKDGGWNSPVGKRLEEEYVGMMERTAHEENCPWRMRGSSRGLYRCQVEGRTKLLESLTTLSSSITSKLGESSGTVRLAHPLTTDQVTKLEDAVQAFRRIRQTPVVPNQEPTLIPTSSILLALFGWTPSPSASPTSALFSCSLCTRQVLLNSFITVPVSASTTASSFNVVTQHQPFCPFIDPSAGAPPSASPSASSATTKRVGWKLRLDTIISKQRTSSSTFDFGGSGESLDSVGDGSGEGATKKLTTASSVLAYVRGILGPKGKRRSTGSLS
ncbi:hypothetical protein T439DRAFT_328175 [Meredithblackwellia eburnea MCA 4105]